jgi:glycine cleavage system H lipoate-binding protein
MTKEVYRSANGKMVDMGAIKLKNEEVRAVGNMNVNARGDVVDDQNRVIATRPEQVNQAYDQQVTNPRKRR